MRKSASVLSLAVACLPLAGADLAPTGTLRATFLAGNPVQATIDSKMGAIGGPVADIVKELARRAAVPYTITPSNGSKELIERLNDGKADIGFLAWEADRARLVEFSGPYLLMETTYLVPSGSPIRNAADADRPGVKIGAVEGNSPTIYLQQHLKEATVIAWPAAPPYEQMLKMFASGQVDAYAGNRARLVEAASRYSGLRVVQDNFTLLEQNIVVRKGDTVRLKILNDFLDEARASTFLKDSLIRAKLAGVQAPPARTR